MEIINFEEMPENSYELAIFDIYLGPKWGLTYNGFRLLRSKAGNLYVKPADFKDKRKFGDKVYTSSIDMKTEKGKDLEKKIMELLGPRLDKYKVAAVQHMPPQQKLMPEVDQDLPF